MPHKPLLTLTWPHTHSGYWLCISAGTYGVRSSRLPWSARVKDGMYWYSICATSGAPCPDWMAVRSFW